jgi:hypothetical protein
MVYGSILLFGLILTCADMDVDGSGLGGDNPMAAEAAAAASAALQGAMAARNCAVNPPTSSSGPAATSNDDNLKEKNTAPGPGNLFVQCSNAKRVSRTATIHECYPRVNGPVFGTAAATIPRVGSMFIPEKDDLAGLFHGARLMKGGMQTNEVLTCSFDPATLNCLACPKPHRVIDKLIPITICFADQNFVPTLRSDLGNTCIAVVHCEDAALADLAAMALEMLDKFSLHPGSVLLFGSASHLFRVGASCYAQDWIGLLGKIEQRFKNVNICPLIPIIRESCPGALARDIEILATWLANVYPSNMLYMLNNMLQYVKIPLPNSLSSAQLHPWYFRHRSSNPALLQGMDCTVT